MVKPYCTCGANKGFKMKSAEWVCASCEKPSRAYLETVMHKAMLGENYEAVVAGFDTFVDKLDARIDAEIDSVTTAHNVPRAIVREICVRAIRSRSKY